MRNKTFTLIFILFLAAVSFLSIFFKDQLKTYRNKAATISSTPSPVELLEVSVAYDSKREEVPLKITGMKKRYRAAYRKITGLQRPGKKFTIEMVDDTNRILESDELVIPETLHDDIALLRNNKFGTSSVALETYNSVVVLIYQSNAKAVVVRSANGDVIQSVPLSGLPAAALSVPLSTAQIQQAREAQTRFVNIAVLSDKFQEGELENYRAVAEQVQNTFFSIEPFNRRRSQIRFHVIDNLQNLGCAPGAPETRIILCNKGAVVSVLNASQVPYDKILVLVNMQGYYGAWYDDVAALAIGQDDAGVTAVHELGHSFGLYDEYSYGYNSQITNSVFANCLAGYPPAASWNHLVKDFNAYTLTCSYNNWYSSSRTSIMRELASRYFNPVSTDVLNTEIDRLAGQLPEDTPEPTATPDPEATATPTSPPQTTATPPPGNTCRDNPYPPPEGGYKWTALCDRQCASNTDCPKGANNQDGWCYGAFREGPRCLRLDAIVVTSAPTLTPTLTPTPNPTTILTPTLTPTPGAASITLRFNVRLQGIVSQIPEYNRQQYIAVRLRNNLTETPTQSILFTTDVNGVWVGQGTFSVSPDTYAVVMKGPKHIQKKICDIRPNENSLGIYRCKSAGIALQAGEITIDATSISLLVGDLPEQNGVVNSEDIAKVRSNLGSTDPQVLRVADVNLDGVVNTQDFSLIIEALSVRTDEE